jgi:hypothetical protein
MRALSFTWPGRFMLCMMPWRRSAVVVEGAVFDAAVGVEDQTRLGPPPPHSVLQRRSGQLGASRLLLRLQPRSRREYLAMTTAKRHCGLTRR